MALNSKPKIQLLPWDACSVWSPPQLWGGGKQKQTEKQSTTSMSPNAVSAWDITDYPSFCLSGVVPLQPPKQIIDFNPINFLDLLIFCIFIASHCLTLIKIYWLNTTSFMSTFLGMQWWKIWACTFFSWISKRKCLYFQFLFPSTFSNKTGKQSLIVISLNVCSTMNLLGLFYSKYHLLTCDNYSSLPSG